MPFESPSSGDSDFFKSQRTLEKLVTLIDANEIDAHLFSGQEGDIFKVERRPQPHSRELIGGCLLDKGMAIINEQAAREHVDDLKTDIAACCAGGSNIEKVHCVSEAAEAFHVLATLEVRCGRSMEAECVDSSAASAATSLLEVAQRRIEPTHLTDQAAYFMGRCVRRARGCMNDASLETARQEAKRLKDVAARKEAAKKKDAEIQAEMEAEPETENKATNIEAIGAETDAQVEAAVLTHGVEPKGAKAADSVAVDDEDIGWSGSVNGAVMKKAVQPAEPKAKAKKALIKEAAHVAPTAKAAHPAKATVKMEKAAPKAPVMKKAHPAKATDKQGEKKVAPKAATMKKAALNQVELETTTLVLR